MCDNMLQAYLARNPKQIFGNFYIVTRQYREYAQLDKDYIFFNTKYLNRFETVNVVYVPCGKCIQCLTNRSKSWEIRSVFEMLQYPDSCCLTLTYNDENLPKCDKNVMINDDEVLTIDDEKRGIINYKDIQDFIKRLRKKFDFRREIKYICGCEYGGSGTLRPHYHILLFGYSPDDISTTKVRRSAKGTILYKSPSLDKLWGKGFVDVGKADVQSARYISQYCCKNLLKERKCASKYNKKVLKAKNMIARECLHASIGLGLRQFKRNFRAIINNGVIRYGKFCYSIPKYFIKKLESFSSELYQNVKQKAREYWLNFKWTQEDQNQARIRTERLLERLNLFHSDVVNCLVS